jgi:hypothetical protein
MQNKYVGAKTKDLFSLDHHMAERRTKRSEDFIIFRTTYVNIKIYTCIYI